MNINFSSLHHIDIASNSIEEITLDVSQQELSKYIEELVDEIVYNTSKRNYRFKDGNTQIKSSLFEILNNSDDIQSIIEENSRRLLEKESQSQQSLANKNLNTVIQKGSLLHLSFEHEEETFRKIILCKVEHDEILEEVDFNKIRGLNTRKKVFKAIFIVFNEDNTIHSCHVYDKYNSKYWWDGFLELTQLYTDSQNTSTSLDEIDKVLNKLKKKFPLDHLFIRNGIIAYYRSNENLDYTDFLNLVIEPYIPYNEDFPINKLHTALLELSNTNKFDTQFSVDKKSINKRMVNKIYLGNNLSLSIDAPNDNLDRIILPSDDINGSKGIQIITDEGYEQLKYLIPKE